MVNQLTPAEWRILGKLLTMARTEFGEAGYNDYDLPLTEGNLAIIEKVKPLYPPQAPNERRPKKVTINKKWGIIHTHDVALLAYFEKRAQEISVEVPVPVDVTVL